MKNKGKRNTFLIIFLLVALNAIAFGVGNYILQSDKTTVLQTENTIKDVASEEEELFKSGWEWLNWSYSLLQYFRNKPQNVSQ